MMCKKNRTMLHRSVNVMVVHPSVRKGHALTYNYMHARDEPSTYKNELILNSVRTLAKSAMHNIFLRCNCTCMST